MYCSHFGLHRPPFNNTPDPTFYFSTPEHEEALATLQYAVFQRKGFVLITGEVGAGKTLIGRMFLRQVDRSAAAAVISHTNLNGRQLLAAICSEFELQTPPDATNLQLTDRLQDFLLEQFAQDRFAVVLVDEAQNLPDESFEELRMLGNLEADDAKLLQICILGQPELRDRLRGSKLRQIDQRLFRRFHLPSLSRQNTRAYILHRLKVAGCARQDLFSDGAIDRIYAASQGIPRLINKICDNALLTAYAASADQVTEAMVDQSVENEMLPAGGESEKVLPDDPAASQTGQPLALTEPATTVTASLADSASVDVEPTDAQVCEFSPEPARLPVKSMEPAVRAEDLLSLKEAARENAGKVHHVAAEEATTKKELKAAREKIEQMWEALNQQTNHYRRDIQNTLDEAIANPDVYAEDILSLKKATHETTRAVRHVADEAATTKKELEAVGEKMEQMREALCQQTDRYRRDIQSTLDEAVGKYQSLQKQMNELASTATSHDELEQLRRTHRQETDQIIADLGVRPEDILSLKKATHETASAVRHVADEAATTKKELKVAGEKMEEMWEALRQRTEQYRRDIQSTLDEAVGKYQSLQKQMNELASTATTHDELELLRRTHRQETDQIIAEIARQGQEFKQLLVDTEQRWQQAKTRLRSLGPAADAQEAIESLQADFDEKVGDLVARLDHHRQHIGRLAEVLQGHCDQTQGELQAIRDAQAKEAQEAERRLSEARTAFEARLAEQEQRIALLDRQIDQRIAAVGDSVSQLEKRSPTGDDLDMVRREQANAVGEILKLLGRQSDELAAFRADLERQTETRSSQHAALIDAANDRIAAQSNHIEQLRQRLLVHLEETEQRFAEMRAQLQAREEAIKDQLSDVRSQLQQESRSLLERLDGQKVAMEAQFDRVLWRLQESQGQLDSLSGSAARTEDVQRFQQEQAEQREKVLAMLGSQRRDLESLADATSARCEALQVSLAALPPDIATVGQLDQVHREHTEQIAGLLKDLDARRTELEQSIQSVTEYCDRTNAAVSALAAEAATASEVEDLRSDHGQQIGQIFQQMDRQTQTHTSHIQSLTSEVESHAERVTQLEEQARKPVRLELAPTAGASLGMVVEAAQQQHGCLSEAVERAGAIAAHLHNASSQVQEVLQHWAGNADAVQEQSRQLRTSAETAVKVLAAMKKCHTALDRKLNSQRWHEELARGEAVAQRLDKATIQAQTATKQLNAVLRDFDRSQESADDWSARMKQAQQTVQQLTRLLSEAASVSSKFDTSLNRRKQVLSAVAQNTTRLMELIEAARQADESVGKPAIRKQEARKANMAGRGADADWPTLRVRPAQVG